MKILSKLTLAITLLLAVPLAVGCDKKGTNDDEQPMVDYVENPAIRLNLDYKGHDFYTDGVGEVTLKAAIDGDTAHFYPVVTTTSSQLIKARFYGVDTPESTGLVEPWGKPASNFTKHKLYEARDNGTIVLSTPRQDYGKPQTDSTGGRYVSLIWINETKKNADVSELRLLNLMLVQEGYSNAKNLADMPEFVDIFVAAEKQAVDHKLNMFSGEIDELFNYGDYEDTSILDLKKSLEQSILHPEEPNPFDNKKVRIVGTIAGFSGGTMYLQNYYTKEQGARNDAGEYAGINIFCGTAAVPSKYTATNTYIQLCGLAQYSENFGFQLTGVQGRFPIVESKATEDDAKILIKPDDNVEEYQLTTLKYTAEELNAVVNAQDEVKKFECLCCATELTTPVEVSDVYFSPNKTSEITLSFKNCAFQAHLEEPYRGDPNDTAMVWNTKEMFMGKKFTMKGIYSFFSSADKNGNITTRYQFNFIQTSDLVWVQDQEDAL